MCFNEKRRNAMALRDSQKKTIRSKGLYMPNRMLLLYDVQKKEKHFMTGGQLMAAHHAIVRAFAEIILSRETC